LHKKGSIFMAKIKGSEFEKGLQQEKDMQTELKKPDLLVNIIKEIKKDGVIGNEDTALALIMKIMLRLVCDSTAESSNMVVSDESGGGKDFITKTICKILLPKNCYYHRTSLTPKVFTYWNTDKKSQKEGFTWSDKVIHIEDPDKDLLNSSGFKTMASGGSANTVVKDQKAVDYKVNGKPIIIITSLNASIDAEGVRRWDSVNVDISKEITKMVNKQAVHKRQRNTLIEKNVALRDGLQRLTTKCVIIPFADELINIFPNRLVYRTLSKVFMDYICASAVLHQYQRKKDENGNIIATLFDYDYAVFVFNKCSTGTGVMLNKIEQEFLEILERYPNSNLSVREIVTQFSRGKDWIYENLDRLKSLKMIGELSEFDPNANREITKLYSKRSLQYDIKGKGGLSYSNLLFSGVESTTNNGVEKSKRGGCRGFLESVRDTIQKMREKEGLSPSLSLIIQKTKKTEQKGII